MKNLITIMIIAIVAVSLYSCRTPGERDIVSVDIAIEDLRLDSCQIDSDNNTSYYLGDTIITVFDPTNIMIVYLNDTTKLNPEKVGEKECVRMIISTLKAKATRLIASGKPAWWVDGEKPENTPNCLTGFSKNTIETQPIDSVSVKKVEKGTQYCFCLQDYKVDIFVKDAIKYKNPKKLSITTTDVNGNVVQKA